MHIKTSAITVLRAADPCDKTRAAKEMARVWQSGQLTTVDDVSIIVPQNPGRPDKPNLVPLYDVKRRRLGTQAGRATLLHAIAHIEFNAINLAADMLARFATSPRIDRTVRTQFINDWVNVCADEARHFTMVNDRLRELESFYGALPAHNGLWQAALATKDDLQARLVIAPMVLEARGLDVTPNMIKKMHSVNDKKSAEILSTIYQEEVAHVAAGVRWFNHICEREHHVPEQQFRALLNKYYQGHLKPPFNHDARNQAGMPKSYYNVDIT